MVAPVIIAAGIAAAASLASAKSQSSAAGSATKQGRQFSLDMYKRQLKDQKKIRKGEYARQDSMYQRATTDATAAGLHPLFALGSSANYSPGSGGGGISIPGYPAGGSSRSGIAEAGAAISRGIIANESNKQSQQAFALQATRVAAEVKRDDAQANYYNALAAKASQEVNSGPRMNEDGAIVVPIGQAGSGIPLSTRTTTPRATRIEPHTNAPLWSKIEKPGGGYYLVLNKEVQADELNQVLIASQGTFDYFQKTGEAIGFKPWELGRKAYSFFRRMAKNSPQRRGHPRRNY